MKNIYKLISIIVLCAVLAVSITASNGSSSMDIYYGIQIAVDGQTATLTDVNGNIVYPFTSNGTTYVPIRAISELLGAGVTYDAETKTAYIFSKEVLDNYNKYGTVTPPTDAKETAFMNQMELDLFKNILAAESCIDEYDYIDYNINAVLYKYYLDTEDAVDFIEELRNNIKEVQQGTLKDIVYWSTRNWLDYSTEIGFTTGQNVNKLGENLEKAFSKMDAALDNLSEYISPTIPNLSEVLRNNYYNRFEDDLEEARKAAIEVSNLCDVYTDVFMKLLDDNIN